MTKESVTLVDYNLNTVTMNIKTLNRTSSLKTLSDQEVFNDLKELASSDLRRYQDEFYYRFAPHIYKGAVLLCRNFKDSDQLAKDITQITFIQAFGAINKFDLKAGLSNNVVTYTLKAWLGKIANNIFYKLYPQIINSEIDIDDLDVLELEPSYDLFEEQYDHKTEEQPSEFQMLLQQAMNSLKEIDRHIILTYAGENCINTTQHLSDNAMRILCETYKTNPDNIRQRKHRALKKINTICKTI